MNGLRHDDDPDIVKGCLAGDHASWSVFTERYSDLIRISIKNCLSRYRVELSDEEIDDIYQETLSSIWNEGKLSTIHNIGSLPYWLSIVSANEALKFCRLNKTDRDNLLKIDDPEKYDLIFDQIHSHGARQGDEFDRNEISQKIDESISSLPPKERLVIKLHFLYDKKYDEISCMLNIPKGTVCSYVKRARARLQKKLRLYKRFLQYFLLFLHLYI